ADARQTCSFSATRQRLAIPFSGMHQQVPYPLHRAQSTANSVAILAHRPAKESSRCERISNAEPFLTSCDNKLGNKAHPYSSFAYSIFASLKMGIARRCL